MNAIWKLVGIGVLGVALLIPLALVEETIGERRHRLLEAQQSIARRWGEAQRVGGPVLEFGWMEPVLDERGQRDVRVNRILAPSMLEITASMETERRYYGIYTVPVFVVSLQIEARFDAEDLAAALAGERRSGPFRVLVPVTDVRGVRGEGLIHFNGEPMELSVSDLPGQGLTALSASLDLDPSMDQHFALNLRLAGTRSLGFLPLGERTRVHLAADWPDPGFRGTYLPDRRTIDENGFEASWEVLALNRGFGQVWLASEDWVARVCAAEFGVELHQPVGIYQRTERSTKYGVLFIAMTFLGYFIVEALLGVRLHPVQYVFLGLAMACFYLLLLALSEHIGFGPAYALATTALCALCGLYSASILGSRLRGGTAAGLLAMIYGLLYVLVIGEDYSLLVGSLALFGLLSLAMLLTRKVDWYRVQVLPNQTVENSRSTPP